MRLWSIHPKYIDQKGLVALWREALLAQKVLSGKTRGYRHHPQLLRFLETDDSLGYIGYYLYEIRKEANRRGYNFKESKILKLSKKNRCISVTRDQLHYEFTHLLKKLKIRDKNQYKKLSSVKKIFAHPSFRVIPGKIEKWERA